MTQENLSESNIIWSNPNWMSRTAVRLTPIFWNENEKLTLSTATGFYIRHPEYSGVFLVSNWHVLAGWDRIRNIALHKKGALPNTIDMSCCFKIGFRNGGSIRHNLETRLFDNDEQPCWFEHPKYGREVDIAVLHLKEIGNPNDKVPLDNFIINDLKNIEDRKTIVPDNKYHPIYNVSDECFVIGFPMGIQGPSGTPIVKRASIASEPNFETNQFYIDTATRTGMSGSPVIVRANTVRDKFKGTRTIFGTQSFFYFARVYSGRLIGKDDYEAQLGIVWKPHLINEIIEGRKSPNYPF